MPDENGECVHPWSAVELTVLKDREGVVAVCTICLCFLPKPSLEFTTVEALCRGAWAEIYPDQPYEQQPALGAGA